MRWNACFKLPLQNNPSARNHDPTRYEKRLGICAVATDPRWKLDPRRQEPRGIRSLAQRRCPPWDPRSNLLIRIARRSHASHLIAAGNQAAIGWYTRPSPEPTVDPCGRLAAGPWRAVNYWNTFTQEHCAACTAFCLCSTRSRVDYYLSTCLHTGMAKR